MAGECPNEQLRGENASTQLPDCRAYELVSPAGPYDSEFNGVSPDGNTVFFASSGAIAGLPPDSNEGNGEVRMFGVTRTGESGWRLSSFTNFAGGEHLYPFLGSSEDGSRIFVTSLELQTPEGVTPTEYSLNLYETGNAEPPTLISHDQNGARLTGTTSESGLRGQIVVSGDGTHVVFSSGYPLTALAAANGGGPYVYEADAAGDVSLVSVTSGGQLPAGGDGAGLGSAAPGDYEGQGVVANAVSNDGSTVFFNSVDQYDPSAPASTGTQVFMRRGDSTVDVSKGVENATYDGASADGDYVVFSDASQNIYEFDAETDTLLPVSSGSGGLNIFLTMSGDGSHVYFASESRLDPNGPPPGGIFLYEWAGGHVTYIATLSSADLSRLESTTPPDIGGAQPGAHQNQAGTRTLGPIRATTDGKHLVFESERPLTMDDRNEEAGRLNVYEYTDGQGLTRVSQGSLPGAGNGPYSATIGSWQQLPDYDPLNGSKFQEDHPFTFGTAQEDGRVIAEDGSVFFSSREALADGATDGPLHVYEWKEGNTFLISPAGPQATDAHYLENSPDGSNVYFSTTQETLPTDTNGGWVNIWDARVDGGLRGPPAAPPCAENECPTTPPAVRGVPASSGFSGPGNARPSPPVLVAMPKTAVKSTSLTRAQKLTTAIRACRRKQRNKHKRATCESRAMKRYGAKPRANVHGRRQG